MNDNIDKNEIRRAIDRLQTEHPCGIAYDPTAFVNMEAVNTIKECVDKIARRMMEDTEINIICEFAKLYLEGVRPMVMPKQEWIPLSERLPEEDGRFLVFLPDRNGTFMCADFLNGEWYTDDYECTSNHVIAWMPLPTPYKEGDPDA